MSNSNSDPILHLKNVCKFYQLGSQTIKALDCVDFKVEDGEFVSIVGPSGSGKSTFLQVASILAEPTKGAIFLKGKNVTEYDEVQRAKLRNQEIGFVFQQFNLLAKTSAIDNVALPLVYAGVDYQARHEKAKAMLQKLGLGNRLDNQPNQLSGGQQQRVAIARALINDPSIIFVDEPTGNLDSESGKEVERILVDLHEQGRSIIMVTHEKRLAKIAERIIELKDGQLIGEYTRPFKEI